MYLVRDRGDNVDEVVCLVRSSGRTSGTPTLGCLAGTPVASSASARCSGSGRRAKKRRRGQSEIKMQDKYNE